MSTTGHWISAFFRALRSNKLFWIFFGIFIFEAVWIAFSGAYSMAYDEYFHFGIIKLYSHQWLPFFGHQPAGADMYGAVVRDPSYLQHYIMSFPLRIFAHFVHGQTAQIIFLRLFDIGFFAAGLLVFRKVFRLAKVSPLVSNLSLIFLTLLPVAPFMAAQINYDDLLFLLTGLTVWLAILVVDEIRDRDHMPVLNMLLLGSVAMLASLVKYVFLPILLSLLIYLIVSIVREIGMRRLDLWTSVKRGSHGLYSWRGLAIVLLFLLSFGLFLERDGLNMWRYHTPSPQCDKVLSVSACQAYDPYGRNYGYKQSNLKSLVSRKDKGDYPLNWLQGMLRSSFFVVSNKENNYTVGLPLPLAYAAGYVVGIGGGLLLVWHARRLWRVNHAYQLFILIIVVYSVTLFAQNLRDFLKLGVSVAIQGRYMVPLLPLAFVLVAESARGMLGRFKPRVSMIIISLLLILMLQGGGFLPFLLRTQDAWLWQNAWVLDANHAARDVFRTIVAHY
ncbi:MAG: hypothetical protein WC498_02225 [Candidatus Saccharimonadales bacterium]